MNRPAPYGSRIRAGPGFLPNQASVIARAGNPGPAFFFTGPRPSRGAGQDGVAVRVPGVAAGLRLAAVRHLVAGVPIALAWNAVDTVRSNPLLQLFHVQEYFRFHCFFFACFAIGLQVRDK